MSRGARHVEGAVETRFTIRSMLLHLRRWKTGRREKKKQTYHTVNRSLRRYDGYTRMLCYVSSLRSSTHHGKLAIIASPRDDGFICVINLDTHIGIASAVEKDRELAMI